MCNLFCQVVNAGSLRHPVSCVFSKTNTFSRNNVVIPSQTTTVLWTIYPAPTMSKSDNTIDSRGKVNQTHFSNWIVSREWSLETLSLLFGRCWPLVPLTTSAQETFLDSSLICSTFTVLSTTGPSFPLPLARILPTDTPALSEWRLCVMARLCVYYSV